MGLISTLRASASGLSAERLTPQPTPMRTDGSTIDPEYELAQLAENELRYAMLARIANGQIRTLQTAIREGRTQ
jgi:flagellar basal body rod protein FlgB